MFMKLFVVLSFVLFISLQSLGQLNDDFSDGDFTANPSWIGQDSLFKVNISGELQLNDTASIANEAYLVSNTGALNFSDTISWGFRLKLLFSNPSTANQPRFYLTSDNYDLNNSLNGYYIAIGETGSGDKINLFRQDGTNSTLICSGVNIHSNNINLKIKVVRDPSGNWDIVSDTSLTGSNFVFEASGFDASHLTSNYCGVYCKYTSSRSTKFIFDDISLTGNVFLDTTAPYVSSIGFSCNNTLELVYSEPVSSSAEVLQNYIISGANVSPSSISIINNTYRLSFLNSFYGGDTLSLNISNVSDLFGNILNDTFNVFIPDSASNLILSENFCDGDFLFNPAWSGSDDLFLINQSGALQLNDTGAINGQAYLVHNTGLLDFSDSLIWNFRFNLLFNNPSSGNQPRFYLTSDNNDLSNSLNGYYITIGETGSNDKIKLYRQDGLSTTEVCSGINTYSNNININIKVTRDIGGNWLVESDSLLNGNNYNYEAGGTDTMHTFSLFSGPYCKYTSSYSQNYIFDDIIIIGDTILDNNPPYIDRAKVTGNNLLNLSYSEPVNYLAEQISSYFLQNTSDQPLTVTIVDGEYQLQFNAPFNGSDTLALVVSNIEDLSANVLNDTVYILVPDTAEFGELLFNEILFDPIPDGGEYIEIYNNSEKIFDLENYWLAKLNEDKDSLVSFEIIDVSSIILPSELLLFTKYPVVTYQDYFNSDPSRFIELSGLSKTYFTNGAETIYLLDPDSNIIDQLQYNEDMHFEIIDDPSGVSLEKINPQANSMDPMQWHSASENSGWGSPGLMNSQNYSSNNNSSIFKVETAVFSPDNDGFQDIALFSYNLETQGFVGSIFIYDNMGRLIKIILNNELLGNQGTATWDGANEQGLKAGVGIYMVYFECFNSTGTVLYNRSAITLKTRF